MDKWSDPLPGLIIGDLAVLIIAGFMIGVGTKKLRRH
jgi:hypothetical protein